MQHRLSFLFAISASDRSRFFRCFPYSIRSLKWVYYLYEPSQTGSADYAAGIWRRNTRLVLALGELVFRFIRIFLKL